MGLLKVIFFIIVGFYLMGFIGRLMLRYWIINKQKEFQQNGRTGGVNFKQYTWGTGPEASRKSTREGEIKVDQNAHNEKKVSGKVGDYVDYEEIKD